MVLESIVTTVIYLFKISELGIHASRAYDFSEISVIGLNLVLILVVWISFQLSFKMRCGSLNPFKFGMSFHYFNFFWEQTLFLQ